MLKKASQKFNTLTRIGSSMDQKKRRIMTKAYINSQFSHCPLAWTMHSRIKNKK